MLARPSGMKVYISADIEGVAGITAPEEANPEHRDSKYFQEQMTEEVAAACEGAISAGAVEILVKDAHWTGRNIDPRRLPLSANLLRGWTGHPYFMMEGLDSSFDAVIFIGYHARAGSGGNPLAHTISSRIVHELRINGIPASEFLVNALTASLEGVPIAFVSGDQSLCAEVKSYDERIHTYAALTGIGAGTLSPHPEISIRDIRRGVESALLEMASRPVGERGRPLPGRFDVEVDFAKVREAYACSFYPGASLLRERTVRFEAQNYFEILRFLQFTVK